MTDPTYIIGHKNPDADSICAAIAYAEFKAATGEPGYLPARCGNSNPRINTILDYFNVPLPMFLGDVTPRLKDIMVPAEAVRSVSTESTCAEALEMIEDYDDRALAVTNSDGTIIGTISIFDLGDYFIPKPSKPKGMRKVHASMESIAKALKAEVFNIQNSQVVEDLSIRIAATEAEYLGKYLEDEGSEPSKSVIVVGNHKEIQKKAIELGVRMLIVTSTVQDDITALAKKHGVSLCQSPYDSATTAWVVRAANHIGPLVQREFSVMRPDEKLSSVRRKVANQMEPLYFVSEGEDKLLGVFTKSDLLKPTQTKLVLVDHNELNQAVDGAEEVNIVEVLDHHKLGNAPTHAPIRFINEPVGSTCTIIANMYKRHGLKPSASTAGIMMGGIITDTLNLNSPTTTDVDRELLPWLGELAGIKPDSFAEMIFSSGSVILSNTPAGVIESDCKMYEENAIRYSASQVEELGLNNFWKHADDIIEALEAYRLKNGLHLAFMLVTDINTQNSLLIVKGLEEFHDIIKHPKVDGYPMIYEMEGVVSRKKQLVPYLTSLLASGSLAPN